MFPFHSESINFRNFPAFEGLAVGWKLTDGLEVGLFDDLEDFAVLSCDGDSGVGHEGADVVGDEGVDARQNTSSPGTSAQTVSWIQS
jgi:hypothetical protein